MFAKSRKVISTSNRDTVHRTFTVIGYRRRNKKKFSLIKVRKREQTKIFYFYLRLYNMEKIKPSIYYDNK